ncbi:hypothetical protein PCASD_18943 [Puccinia coronata f. sp. avenae]|uniref:MIF4G domain-containing protein n=1 Tax=Puccinia coronata f. sp. avenae TaxID=200324 RepID=A0A2N5T219_9BASI|nr:hypothetical protein PCASD_18943 [Puccinia coronata f. sp. avenae]
MVNFSNFLFVACTLSIACAAGKRSLSTQASIDASQGKSVYRNSQATRDQIINKRDLPSIEISNSSEFTPTTVIPEKPTEKHQKNSEKLDRRTFGRSHGGSKGRYNLKQIRVHGYLVECLNGILPHTQFIKTLCAKELKKDPERVGWVLVGKLRAILDVLNGCLAKLKDCGKAPAPSSVPGGTPPSMGDICHILFKIMCELRACCVVIGTLCNKYSIIRRVCNDTLVQITGCLSSLSIRSGAEVGNIFTGLGQLFGTVPKFFAPVPFGFQGIPRVLGGGNRFFSFRDFY